eukprot:TRINITY_DN14187_c0_g1_i1.p1 TRINITY_DN14187_c0_g1~~TRINITY_DN14187_c0_g1_i1.p1  ORF type:complete len:329 (+),score=100.06 TRINITY_DN14187_c0_g1_i1:81-1067(+)
MCIRDSINAEYGDLAMSVMAGTTTELHRAIKHEDVERVERLLSALDQEVDINAEEAGLGSTAMHLAAFIKNSQTSKAICQLLLDASAKKDSKDLYGSTPEDVARRRGNPEVAAFIADFQGQGNWFSRQRLLHSVFNAFDLDGNGLIEEDELLEINQGLHPQGWTPDQNRAMMNQVDSNSDGRLTRHELFAYYKKNLSKVSDGVFEDGINHLLGSSLQARRLTNYQLGRVKQIFEAFDTDDDGVIDEGEFWVISHRMAPKIHDKEWTREDSRLAMVQFDTDGDGYITLHEFLEFFRQQLGDVSHELFEKALTMFNDVLEGKPASSLFQE